MNVKLPLVFTERLVNVFELIFNVATTTAEEIAVTEPDPLEEKFKLVKLLLLIDNEEPDEKLVDGTKIPCNVPDVKP